MEDERMEEIRKGGWRVEAWDEGWEEGRKEIGEGGMDGEKEG